MRDFKEFTLRIFIDATPEQAMNAWMTSGQLERWFLTKASYCRLGPEEPATEGTRYRWEWAEGTVEEGEVTQVDPGALLAFTFGEGADVVVRVGSLDGRTVVELVQRHDIADEGKRADYYVGCVTGWTFYFANLKSVLEGGLDLRETRVDLPDLVNV